MRESREQRQVPRVRLPAPLSGRVLGILTFRHFDLSIASARIAHSDPVPPSSAWTLELPATLGGQTLSARVIWTRVIGGKEASEAGRLPRYESGLPFVHLTTEQQAGLASILRRLATQTKVLDKVHRRRKTRSHAR